MPDESLSRQDDTVKVLRLPLYSRGGIVGYALVLDDDFGREMSKKRWNVTAAGYPVRNEGYLHHFVYAHYHGEISFGCEIDHQDRNKHNALPSNLRPITRSANIANSGKRQKNKSGFKGVSWDKANNKWRASITVNYVGINLGRHTTKEDAARAVNAAYRKYFPEVAVPNPEVEQ